MIGGISIRNHGLHGILQQKSLVATGIALLVHTVGLVGMVWIDQAWFASMTPVNLLLMSALLLWTQESKDRLFYAVVGLSFFTGMLTEITGVHTGLLFGEYAYGTKMGFAIFGVPVVIGVNWFVVVFSAACAASLLAERIRRLLRMSPATGVAARIPLMDVLLSVTLAVGFDWIMEPAAVRLGFWTWAGDGNVPMLNYLTWFAVCLFLLTVMRYFRVATRNAFAVHLLLIQAMFFVMVRWLL